MVELQAVEPGVLGPAVVELRAVEQAALELQVVELAVQGTVAELQAVELAVVGPVVELRVVEQAVVGPAVVELGVVGPAVVELQAVAAMAKVGTAMAARLPATGTGPAEPETAVGMALATEEVTAVATVGRDPLSRALMRDAQRR